MSRSSGITVRLDRHEELKMLRGYTPEAVDRILTESAKKGAQQAKEVMRDHAPVGTSDRPSQYYRRQGLPHGTFRASVKASKIRSTIGYVIGPQGKNAFTRGWLEWGTRRGMRGTHWVASTASSAFSAA